MYVLEVLLCTCYHDHDHECPSSNIPIPKGGCFQFWYCM